MTWTWNPGFSVQTELFFTDSDLTLNWTPWVLCYDCLLTFLWWLGLGLKYVHPRWLGLELGLWVHLNFMWLTRTWNLGISVQTALELFLSDLNLELGFELELNILGSCENLNLDFSLATWTWTWTWNPRYSAKTAHEVFLIDLDLDLTPWVIFTAF